MNDAVSEHLPLKDVKRSALVACIATIMGLAIPMRNFAQQMLALKNIGKLGAIAVIVVVYAFTAIVPLFYFALYRNEGDLPVSRNLRWMALTAAAVIGILSIAAVPGWIASLQIDNVLHGAARPWTINDTSSLLGLIANLAGILLLASFFRLAGDGPSESAAAVSKQLRILTKIAIIAGGIVAVGCVVGLAATPWVYFEIRARSLEVGSSNASLTFWRFTLDRVRAAVAAVSVYIAPFVVWQGSRMHVSKQTSNA